MWFVCVCVCVLNLQNIIWLQFITTTFEHTIVAPMADLLDHYTAIRIKTAYCMTSFLLT